MLKDSRPGIVRLDLHAILLDRLADRVEVSPVVVHTPCVVCLISWLPIVNLRHTNRLFFRLRVFSFWRVPILGDVNRRVVSVPQVGEVFTEAPSDISQPRQLCCII